MKFKFTPYDNSASAGSIAQLMLQSGQIQSDKLNELARIAAQQQTQQGDRSAALINSIAAAVGAGVNATAKNMSDSDYDPGGSKFSGPMQPTAYQPGGSQFQGPIWQPSQAQSPTMSDVLGRMGAQPAPAPQGQYQSPQQDALNNWLAYFGKG